MLMKHNSSIFLSQSYLDTVDDYNRSLYSSSYPHWDYIVLTASNELQAEIFNKQIIERKHNHMLPQKTKFVIVPDRDGKRVGSGGATLSVLREIYKLEGKFKGLRILVIHSGGDSKRVPQYSAVGKLFSPVPKTLPNGRLSTLFDEFLISMSSMAGRIHEGMMLLSGDVLLLFNPLQVDYSGKGAACISFKEDVNTGKNHGVYLNGEDGYVRQCLQKQSVERLKEVGAVDERNMVDIDTGAVIFSSEMLDSLYQMVDTDKKYDKYVNDKVRLSLYADFLYPLATDSTLERFYRERPEGEMCEELLKARKVVWNLLSGYKMKLFRLAPAKFVHFGTTKEILNLMNNEVDNYKLLGWNRVVGCSFDNVSGYNSVISKGAKVGTGCYIETSYVHSVGTVGNNVVLSYIDVHDEVIPDNVVVHGLKLLNGKFVVRIWGVDDNPKESKLFGKELYETELGMDCALWNAEVYPVKDNIKEALKASLNVYDILHGKGDLKSWKKEKKISLAQGFLNADPNALIDWDKRMLDLVKMDSILKLIQNKEPVEIVKGILSNKKLSKIQVDWLDNQVGKADFSTKIRLYYYVGMALGGSVGDKYIQNAFKTIQSEILKSSYESVKLDQSLKITKDVQTTKMPLRVNFGGGWSDTPPYCIENGGTVLNAAILLNGEMPVEVTIERLKENKIVFESKDMDVYGEFVDIKSLQNTGDPNDSFALQKAALVSIGLIPQKGGNLTEVLTRIGGGFKIDSEVTNVPKGSGLGTSSILSAAVVKALFEFFGKDYTEHDLYQTVLVMEQIMSTGGGWQDQVGGAIDGFKLISSKPGICQQLNVEHIQLDSKTEKELNNRFCLIYTGQRRLARNLLRDVVGRYIGNVKDSVSAHKKIQVVANQMKKALLNGNVEEFISLYNSHYALSLKIDSGSSNTLIEQIFMSIEDLIDARMICGAGGGGFVSVFTKKGVSKKQIHDRLKEVFMDFNVDVWDTRFV